MLEKGKFELTPHQYFKILPIGLTMEQIKKYKLPPNPTKLTDSRSNAYVAKFGKTCWEVDALNPRTLTSIVESNIREQIDIGMYEEVREREEADIETLKNFISKK